MNVPGVTRPAYLEGDSSPRTWSRAFFARAIHIYRKDDLAGASAELSYRFAIAIFPFLLLLLTIGAFAANIDGESGEDPAQYVSRVFGDSLPGDTRRFIETQVQQIVDNDSWSLLALGLVGTLWTATLGMLSIMKATNRINDVEETRPLKRRVPMALALTLVAGGGIIVTLAATIVTETYADEIVGLAGLGEGYSWLVALARVPAVLLVITAAVSLIYWLAPNCGQPFHFATPGAIVFAVGWAISSWLFALYVANFGNYTATYGTLGAALIMLIWLQITSTLLYLGAELNALVDPGVRSKGVKS